MPKIIITEQIESLCEKVLPKYLEGGLDVLTAIQEGRMLLEQSILSGELVPREALLSKTEQIELLAQAYCKKRNWQKELDADLILDMVEALILAQQSKIAEVERA